MDVSRDLKKINDEVLKGLGSNILLKVKKKVKFIFINNSIGHYEKKLLIFSKEWGLYIQNFLLHHLVEKVYLNYF